MTISAKIWPSVFPCMRAKAISARLPALSMSSRQSRITSGLRRVSTPAPPRQKMNAEAIRYQATSMPSPPPSTVELVVLLGLVRDARGQHRADRLGHRARVGRANELGPLRGAGELLDAPPLA